MSMNINTNYSSYTSQYTKADIPNAGELLHGANYNIRKDQEPLKPELDEWKKKCEELRGGKDRNDSGAIYDKNGEKIDNSSYSINKMSASDRAAVAEQLRNAAEQRQKQLVDIVKKTISGQVGAFGKANDDSIWRTLASGNFTVDAATKAQAQKDIGEDGYWGVKQTSQRLFDFASALAGDDVENMKKMQAAMEKGFKLATGAWGKKLPSICSETMDAANKLFEDYYESKSSE